LVAPISFGLYCFCSRNVCLYAFMFLFLIIDWVDSLVAFWFGFTNTKGFGYIYLKWLVLFTRKVCVVSTGLDTSDDLGLITSVLGFRLFWCSCTFWFSDVSGLLRSAGFKASSLPPLRLSSCLSQSLWLCLDCFARKNICLLLLFRGLLVRGSLYVLAVDLFTSLTPFFLSLLIITLHLFL
jgi:hypothetical protein